jgi:hypothetical protein
MSQTRPRAYEISSVFIALAIKRAIERAKGAGDGRLRSRVGRPNSCRCETGDGGMTRISPGSHPFSAFLASTSVRASSSSPSPAAPAPPCARSPTDEPEAKHPAADERQRDENDGKQRTPHDGPHPAFSPRRQP